MPDNSEDIIQDGMYEREGRREGGREQGERKKNRLD
jgi:hypothetical protein